MKIVFFEVENWEKELLNQYLSSHQLSFFDEPLSTANAHLAADAEIISVFIYSKINAEVLSKLPALKLVSTRSMGFDHIDLTAAQEKNIVVSNVPAYGERTVAEHAFALILALSRKVMAAYERTEKMNFDYHGLTGFDLQGKTIGIVGGGRIGLSVAKIARNGFEMKVLVSDPYPKAELASQLGFEYVSLEELLKQSDVISLHAPYMPATHHLINQDNIKLIKKGAILINTARGGLVDTTALLQALNQGILSGAGLDVLEEEGTIHEETEIMSKAFSEQHNLATIIQNHLLTTRNDVVITPHIAFNSKEALEKILSTTAENITSFEKGHILNQIKPKV
jgi:D-lactate dehydrogenase